MNAFDQGTDVYLHGLYPLNYFLKRILYLYYEESVGGQSFFAVKLQVIYMDLYKELEFNPFDASRTSNINVS
jgi:hypothetical protein